MNISMYNSLDVIESPHRERAGNYSNRVFSEAEETVERRVGCRRFNRCRLQADTVLNSGFLVSFIASLNCLL